MKKLENRDNTHQFAIYAPDFSGEVGTTVLISSQNIIKRLSVILRLKAGDLCIFFTRFFRSKVEIISIKSKKIEVKILSVQSSDKILPEIVLGLPLLKKTYLEQAIYSAVEMGVSEIQLITTAKSNKKVGSYDFARFERIVISAAEQSKHFYIPQIHNTVIKFEDFCTNHAETSERLFFDFSGVCIKSSISRLQLAQKISILVGPEGDLISEEKELLLQNKWTFIALTPTVLRSFQAVGIAVGIIRSLI